MKVTKAVESNFTPISRTITFETQEEVDLLYNTYVVTNVTVLSGASPTDCRSAVNKLLGSLSESLRDSATPIKT